MSRSGGFYRIGEKQELYGKAFLWGYISRSPFGVHLGQVICGNTPEGNARNGVEGMAFYTFLFGFAFFIYICFSNKKSLVMMSSNSIVSAVSIPI